MTYADLLDKIQATVEARGLNFYHYTLDFVNEYDGEFPVVVLPPPVSSFAWPDTNILSPTEIYTIILFCIDTIDPQSDRTEKEAVVSAQWLNARNLLIDLGDTLSESDTPYNFIPNSPAPRITPYMDIAWNTHHTSGVGLEFTYQTIPSYECVEELPAPDQVTGLEVASVTTSSIVLTWNPLSNATSYEVELDGVPIDVGNVSTYTQEGLAEDTEYTFRVRARNSSGPGDWSDPVTQRTSASGTVVNLSRLTLAGTNVETTTGNYPQMVSNGAAIFGRTWQLTGALTGVDDLVSNGGNYPDDLMVQVPMSTDSYLAGRNYIRHKQGIPYAVGNNVYWNTPFTFDASDPVGTGVFLNNSLLGPYRLHSSMVFTELNRGNQNRSTVYRDFDGNPEQGRRAGIYDFDDNRLENLGINPFLEPVSTGATKLDGSPVENVSYVFFPIRLVSDSDTCNFFWPGQDTGNYASGSTDGPHYAFNIWQRKGRFSGVVCINMKWRGEQMILLQQDPDGNVTPSTQSGFVLIGPNGVVTDNLSTMANEWLYFVCKVIPGRTSLGDSPTVELSFRKASDASWTDLYSASDDLLADRDNYEQYGVPTNYIGTANFGLYGSTRTSGVALRDDWSPFLANDEGGTTKYITVDHGENYYHDCAIGDDPGMAAVQAAVDSLLA